MQVISVRCFFVLLLGLFPSTLRRRVALRFRPAAFLLLQCWLFISSCRCSCASSPLRLVAVPLCVGYPATLFGRSSLLRILFLSIGSCFVFPGVLPF